MKKNLLFIFLFILATLCSAGSLKNVYWWWDSSEDIAFKAAWRNDYPTFSRMLKKGVDVNTYDRDRGSLLCRTVKYGSLEMLRLLLEKDSQVKVWILNKALTTAAERGRMDIWRELLEAKTAVKTGYWDAFMSAAAEAGSYGIVEMLLKTGAEPNSSIYYVPLHNAVSRRRIEIVRLLLAKGADVNAMRYPFGAIRSRVISALALAVSGRPRSQLTLTEMLLNAGAQVNLYYEKAPLETFPLYLAVKSGNADLVELLLKHGAELNKKTRLKDKIITPLSLAIENKYPDIARILQEYGAKATSEQLEAIKKLESSKKTEEDKFLKNQYSYKSVKKAIASGMDINKVNCYRRTPLEEVFHWFPGYSDFDFDVPRLLLKHDAGNKNYALQYAIERGNIAGVKLLLKYGADPTVDCREATEIKSVMALSKNVTAILPLLLKAGVDPKCRDHNGDNLLSKYYDRFEDSMEFETLIKAGFDWKNVNNQGESVAEIIIKKDKSGRYDSNIKILLKYGADRKKIRELAEEYDRKNLLFLLDNVWIKK
jgi:ankyrin repeat protein